MFKNPGAKIKALAIVFFVLLFLGSLGGGGYLIYLGIDYSHNELLLYGILAILVGFLVAWLSVLFMYAFGSMVDDVQTIRTRLEYQSYQPSFQQSYQPPYQPAYQPNPAPNYQQTYEQSPSQDYLP